MIDRAHLFALDQEWSRATAVTDEAVEAKLASDEGHGVPSHARERTQAAIDALARHEVAVAGLKFALQRAATELAGQSDWDAA